MRLCINSALVCSLGMMCGVAAGQSLNIRFGTTATTPSSTYAAAGLPGVWNSFQVTPVNATYPLVSLAGTPVAAQYYQNGSSYMLTYDNPLTSGDDGMLMDSMIISTNSPTDGCFWVQNLYLGQYEVTMYAMTPNSPSLMTRTRVDNGSPGPTMVGGTWPGQHQAGVTYARFTVTTTDGVIAFHDGLAGASIQSGINAVQLRFLGTCPVPGLAAQPSSIATCRPGVSTFSVTASGTGPFAYRWQIEATPVGSNVWSDLSDGAISGTGASASNSGTATLTITTTQAYGPVRLQCRVANACGSTYSNAATLAVFPTASGDGNASGAADGSDVQGFVATLIQGGSASAAYCAYDMNGDGAVTAADVAGFVARLLGH